MMTIIHTDIIRIMIIIVLFANLNLLAQDDDKPKSMIIGSMTANPPNRNYDDESIGAHLSFRPSFLYASSNSCVGVNAGYIHYKYDGIAKEDYTLTLGIYNDIYKLDGNNY